MAVQLDRIEINPQISFDYCIKCTICNTVCPVTPVFPEFPGPKYVGPDSERFRIQKRFAVEEVSKYCINCKRCEAICPSDVKITHFIEEDKFRHKKSLRKKMRGLFFIYMDLIGRWATRFSGVANFFLRKRWVKIVLEKIMLIARQRKLPSYNKQSFVSYYKEHYRKPSAPIMTVYFFYGCNINYNDLQLGIDFLQFCSHHNIAVEIFDQKCCGIPVASAGESDAYYRRIQENFANFWPIIQSGHKIVSLSSTCSMTIKKDYLRHLDLIEDEQRRYQSGILYFNEFLQVLEEEGVCVDYNSGNTPLAYHVPCHVKFSGEQANTVSLLRRISPEQVHVYDENCCGIGGSYGVKQEFYDISQEVGSLLFAKLGRQKDSVLVTECETCRMQIGENMDRPVYHPLSLMVRQVKT